MLNGCHRRGPRGFEGREALCAVLGWCEVLQIIFAHFILPKYTRLNPTTEIKALSQLLHSCFWEGLHSSTLHLDYTLDAEKQPRETVALKVLGPFPQSLLHSGW